MNKDNLQKMSQQTKLQNDRCLHRTTSCSSGLCCQRLMREEDFFLISENIKCLCAECQSLKMPSKIDLYLSICNTFQKHVNKIKRYGRGDGGGGAAYL